MKAKGKKNELTTDKKVQDMDLLARMVQESVAAATKATSTVLVEYMNNFQEEIKQEVYNIKDIITEQEIRHAKQMEKTQKQMDEAKDLIGLRQKNVASLVKLLKARLTDLAGERVSAESYYYVTAKEKLFRKYGVQYWEQFPIHLYNAVHADIDSIDDLDNIYFE
ncbi:hypothetical protein LZ906_017425 (plasmid) [Paraclostridium ghonii]|uniref:hypothetical protein n=1 Tax=Paraclostridium ghonii TaxID=29358 RepID=UPI00202CAD4C|nr:hypothetical protein [Paeniclostridium ghonii]MCM0166560.1 hypothetical protein [Paeniclostridium ghonii]